MIHHAIFTTITRDQTCRVKLCESLANLAAFADFAQRPAD